MKRLAILLCFLFPMLLLGQNVSIGDILCTDGSTVKPEQFASSGKTAEGIVFFVDGENRLGWAVSLEFQATLKPRFPIASASNETLFTGTIFEQLTIRKVSLSF